MSKNAQSALGRIAEIASTQVAMLEEAYAREDLNLENVAASALDLLLRSIQSEADALASASDTSAELREPLTAAAKAIGALQARKVDVGTHLIELSSDWRCKQCRADVAAGVSLSGLQDGPLLTQIVCAQCGTSSAIAPSGKKHFRRTFGHLLGQPWDPRRNGFGWDGS